MDTLEKCNKAKQIQLNKSAAELEFCIHTQREYINCIFFHKYVVYRGYCEIFSPINICAGPEKCSGPLAFCNKCDQFLCHFKTRMFYVYYICFKEQINCHFVAYSIGRPIVEPIEPPTSIANNAVQDSRLARRAIAPNET